MKSKFILILAAAVLIVVLFALVILGTLLSIDKVVPALEVDSGVAGISVAAETADLAVMDIGALLSIEKIVPAPPAELAGTSMCLALGAILATTTVASKRRLYDFLTTRMFNFRSISGGTSEGTDMGGGPNKCILPAAA